MDLEFGGSMNYSDFEWVICPDCLGIGCIWCNFKGEVKEVDEAEARLPIEEEKE